jgi:formiminotetrahydrofolate cyclodeaminase
MVGRIAERKEPSEVTTALITEADFLRTDFIRLVDDDSAAFLHVSEAMKMPKSSEDEKRARTERLQGALLGASRVPLEVAKTSRRLLDLCERTIERASTATLSDIGVGAFLAETALRGAALNVMINLASLKDAAQVKALSEDLDRAVDGADEQRKRITDFVESRIAR